MWEALGPAPQLSGLCPPGPGYIPVSFPTLLAHCGSSSPHNSGFRGMFRFPYWAPPRCMPSSMVFKVVFLLPQNRLQESMKLFSSVCNNVFFQSTSLILFLNKIDLLQEKILHLGRLLCLSFPQYPGADCDVGAAARCITSLFLSCSETPQKLIYHHVSTATDTCSVQGVFHVVTDTIVQENLEAAALL
ncbi:Guanine nucleotide-binding protein G(o) subunit alpha [Chelonia mydas]|uniref:Guanine nucleotide-binding protein G(O) subunit alpha n=1 Tax=Chelonia mydas TaxID=8469 RepID=M7BA58_CHEMY|nr:Guanine nucleotide-binding protein G(o) subunit alpha [Chelonia mydas]